MNINNQEAKEKEKMLLEVTKMESEIKINKNPIQANPSNPRNPRRFIKGRDDVPKDKNPDKALIKEIERMEREISTSSKEKVTGGRDLPDENFDPEQLKKGIEVEGEHTNDKEEAKAIAKDHLVEIGDYYTRLNKMEDEVTRGKENLESEIGTWLKNLPQSPSDEIVHKWATDNGYPTDEVEAAIYKIAKRGMETIKPYQAPIKKPKKSDIMETDDGKNIMDEIEELGKRIPQADNNEPSPVPTNQVPKENGQEEEEECKGGQNRIEETGQDEEAPDYKSPVAPPPKSPVKIPVEKPTIEPAKESIKQYLEDKKEFVHHTPNKGN